MGICCSSPHQKEKDSLKKVAKKEVRDVISDAVNDPKDTIERTGKVIGALFDLVINKEISKGKVDGRFFSFMPQVESDEFPGVRSRVPTVKRIMLDKEDNQKSDIGTRTKTLFFNDYPNLVFNVAAGVGDFDDVGLYGDPRSIWFNIFVGYYEMIVYKKDGWKRPFGYAEDQKTVNKEDFLRLFAADWNYFSAWMYGVPSEECEKYIPEKLGLIEKKDDFLIVSKDRIQPFEGSRFYDEITLKSVPCVSAYQSLHDGAQKLKDNDELTPLWRESFGLPLREKLDDYPTSFFESRLTGVEWVYCKETNDAFHTIIFGGGFANDTLIDNGVSTAEKNQRFIDAQKKGCAKIMKDYFPDSGFAENHSHNE